MHLRRESVKELLKHMAQKRGYVTGWGTYFARSRSANFNAQSALSGYPLDATGLTNSDPLARLDIERNVL
jgi:hypothetical protein